MKLLLKNNLLLFSLFGVFLIGGAIMLALTTKENLHLFFNAYVTTSLNPFFAYITNFGDGIFVVLSLVIILFINFRLFLSAALAYAVASALTQFLKLFPFDDVVRPIQHFGMMHVKLNYVLAESEMLGRNSFPSGHSTAAFSLFFSLALASQKKWIKAGCLVMAVLVAFSRVYLSQHFFEDIYAGAIIGTFFSVLFFFIFYFSSFSGKFNKLESPVLKILFTPKNNV